MNGPSQAAESKWQVLFDGRSTEALRGYGMDGFPAEGWLVADGELRTIPGPGVDLITRDEFTDFELEFEWSVGPGGNSGVIYRVAETPDPSWTTGPEYQVLDDGRHPDASDSTTSAAALYDLIAPGPEKRLEPVGMFNTGRIVVRDGRVEHWLNGKLVVDYGWNEPVTRALIEASKFARYEGFMAQDSGHVVFQHHGEEAAFRAIRIRPLEGD
jgi:3-keto-disaccharide hydrolase